MKEKDEKLRLFMKENEKLAKDVREIRSYAEKKYDGKTKDIPMSSLVKNRKIGTITSPSLKKKYFQTAGL